MEFGMFHEFQRVPGQTEAAAFAESFEQVDAAEAQGLDAMWLAELHVAPDRSVLAAPLNIASAIATRTSRMKIGIAVQVLPLCHPLRLAEEAATVDHISHGRLIFGVGRSGFPRTYEAYGISYAESRERFAEVLEIVRRAWTQERFSFDGQFYHFENVCLVPKPYQQPHPEIRIAATSADTYPAIGALGYPIFCAVRLGTLSELAPNIQAYRDAWRTAGHPGEGQVFLRVPVYVAETEARARAEPEESIMHFYRYLGAQLADFGNPRRGAGDRAAGRTRPAPANHRLRRSAARKNHRRHPGDGRRQAARTARRTRVERHPGGDELRQPHPARAGDGLAGAALPRRHAPIPPNGVGRISVAQSAVTAAECAALFRPTVQA